MKRDLRWKQRANTGNSCYDHSVPGRPLPIGVYSHNLQFGFYLWCMPDDLAAKLNITDHRGLASNETAARIAIEDAYLGGLMWLEGKLETTDG